VKIEQFKKLITQTFTLNEPKGTEWSPGLLGTILPMWRANPIKLPLFLPAFIALGIGGLGLAGIIEIKKSIKKTKEHNIVEIAKNLNEENIETFKKYLQHNAYDKELYFHTISHHLIKNNDVNGLYLFLDNISFQKEDAKKEVKENDFNHFVNDLFYSLTYNLPFMKEVMAEKILENFAQKHHQNFEIDVDYYKGVIPAVIASQNRKPESSVQNTLNYLNNYPSTWSYNGETKKFTL
jgi:hypothetical protein